MSFAQPLYCLINMGRSFHQGIENLDYEPGYRPRISANITDGWLYYPCARVECDRNFNLMKTRKITVLSAAVVGAFLPTANTQAQDISSSETLERISIVGSRQATNQNQIASASYVLDQEMIEQSGQLFLIDILRGMPGVSVAQSGSAGGLTELRLRGAESNHLLVMIDGIVVNDEGQGGFVDFAHIASDGIIRIELLSGPQSALWGNGAVAGVLSITTRNSQQNHKSLSVNIGNNQTIGAGVKAAGKLVDGLRYHGSLQHNQTDGNNVSRQGNEDDGYQNTTTTGGLDWQIDTQQSLKIQMRHVDFSNDFDATDFVNTGLSVDANNVTEGNQLSAKISYQRLKPNTDFSHNLEYQFSRNNSENFSDSQLTAETDARKHRALYWVGYSGIDDANINVGGEWVRDDYRQRGPIGFGDPNQNQDVSAYAVFTDAVIGLPAPISLNLSARIDNNSDFDNQTSYRLGTSWQISDAWRSFVSYGQAIRNPTFTERFGFFPGTFLGNDALTPETAKTLEAGIEFQASPNTLINLNWFDTNLEDEINGFVFDPDFGGFTAANSVNESQRQGAEVSYSWRANDWQLQAYYSYIDASEEVADGSALTELRRPKHSGSLSVTFSPSNLPFTMNVKADYTGSRFDQFFPPFPEPSQRVGLKPYTLLNTSIQYHANDSATVQLSAHNLLNQDYEDIVGFVGESRQIRLSVNYSFE